MKRLDLYLGWTVGLATLLASVGLVGLFFLFDFIGQLEQMKGGYTVWKVLSYLVHSLPRMFYDTVPYATLIGCLAGLGMLAGNSELIVMRAAGVSTWRIGWGAMQPVLLLVFAGLAVGELVLPSAERSARFIKEDATVADITPRGGFWYREGDLFVHFSRVGYDGDLRGISQYEIEQNKSMRRSLWADSAEFVPEGGYWILRGVRATDFGGGEGGGLDTSARAGGGLEGAGVAAGTRGSDSRSADLRRPDLRSADFHAAELRWETALTPELLSTEILIKPEQMSIFQLYRKINHLEEQSLATGKFELGLYTKLFQPLASLALVLVAISFIFGPLRETTMGVRITAGLVTGLVFKFIQDLLAPASLVYGFPPLVATLLPILVCLAIGAYLLKRAN